MAIRIEAQLSKKIPIPGSEFSSQQASVSISSEVSNPNEVVAESIRLYALAEQAVNQQLKVHVPFQANPVIQREPQRPTQSSAPYRGNQRRGPSDSQLRYLSHLIEKTRTSVGAILNEFQVADLSQLSAKDAAAIIENLKGVRS